ncbi:MAG TPA: tetratricopeptide repeat-containing protein, partial [Pyrinomonadaceae bacterium]|nr:tetratricopeptide repeat-containing protein [Pyrinomonadaceae bacterium]
MSIAYVIHCDADRDTVEQKLLRPLPSNGFDRWVSSTFLSQDLKPEKAMEACDVIFAVVSRAAADSTNVTTEIIEGCTNLTPMIVVQVEDLTDENRSRFPEAVWQLPIIDLGKPEPEIRQVLAALLPAPEPGAGELADVAKQIEWNEEMLSEALARVLELRHYQQAETLIANLAQHIKDRPYPYPAKHAINDLKALRNQRQFKLMRQYGDAVISSGTQDEEVRRQYAQALIEQGVFDKALEVLNSIIADPKSRLREVEEAHGLIGRTYKQQYQDNPD